MQKPRKNGIILGFVTVFMINMNDNQSLYDIIQKLKLSNTDISSEMAVIAKSTSFIFICDFQVSPTFE